MSTCGLLQRRGVLTYRFRRRCAERVVALDQRHEPRARNGDEVDAGVEGMHELGIASGGDRAFGGEQPDAPVACRLDCGVRFRGDHPDDRDVELLLQLRQRRRGRRVAGVDDELHSLALEIRPDLPRELADLRERPRPIGEPCVVSEVDEILVGHRDEAFVQDGQAAHARVEYADRPRIHRAIV